MRSEEIHRHQDQKAEYHPGIQISKIPVKGIAGLFFAIAIVSIFLVAFRFARQFLVLTGIAGILGAGILYLWHNRARR